MSGSGSSYFMTPYRTYTNACDVGVCRELAAFVASNGENNRFIVVGAVCAVRLDAIVVGTCFAGHIRAHVWQSVTGHGEQSKMSALEVSSF